MTESNKMVVSLKGPSSILLDSISESRKCVTLFVISHSYGFGRVSKQTEGDRQMTSKNPINYAEVLKNNISGTTSKSLTQYSLKRLDGMKKYLFISNMGNIDRAYNKVDAELQSANAYMQAVVEADFVADAKGGYGQGSQDFIKEFGFTGGVMDCQMIIEDLTAVRDVLENFFNSNNDDFEQMFGYKFKPNWIGNESSPAKSSAQLTSAEKAELKKKYLKA